MDHVAIMKKSWGLIPRILSGQKIIESRWYMAKYSPWNRISEGDVVYCKNSGEPVAVKAEVQKVIQISYLTPEKVRKVIYKYGEADGLGIRDIPRFYRTFKDKKYCILVFIRNPERIEPFEIDKSGFGMMSGWLSVVDINQIRLK